MPPAAPRGPFDSIYSHGFVRVAVCTPAVDVARPEFNLAETLALARKASDQAAVLAVFPELGLSAYSNEDLFQQDALLDSVQTVVEQLVDASRDLRSVIVAGAPLRSENKLFNCGIVIYRGRVLAVVPKTFLPNYREFYEKRQFSAASQAVRDTISLCGQTAPFGNDVIVEASNAPAFALHVELCEDVWAPLPPSSWAALAGATILANLSASDVTVGKADYRRLLCASQSAKCIGVYLYSAAGPGESTTDLAWDGHSLIYENGEALAESQRFGQPGLITADVDLDRLRQERMRTTSFQDCVALHRNRLVSARRVQFDLKVPPEPVPLERRVDRFPYVPSDLRSRDERCAEVYHIQVQGLAKRLQATGIQKAVIGVSGGLDSTQALLVCVGAFDHLKLPRTNILGYSLPGFATSRRTRDSAHELLRALGVTAGEIDIRPSSEQMLKDIGHPNSRGERVFDVTFENVQAGDRTSHLFRLANLHQAVVVGTSDLSELALGFTTYGVGDHMSHYSVNASVPKTLIQHLIRWLIVTDRFDTATRQVLERIVNTAISPELVPGDGDEPGQHTESITGPYELQDFHLYYTSRFGYRPSKVAWLAWNAWRDRAKGSWPDTVPPDQRRQYDLAEIRKWLEVFLRRFFETSQFKRSAMPNGPKVGSGGSLSPRGDWRAPSDARADAWLRELHETRD
jgi:NAD+ synthase (glutamine-hydrolysing)